MISVQQTLTTAHNQSVQMENLTPDYRKSSSAKAEHTNEQHRNMANGKYIFCVGLFWLLSWLGENITISLIIRHSEHSTTKLGPESSSTCSYNMQNCPIKRQKDGQNMVSRLNDHATKFFMQKMSSMLFPLLIYIPDFSFVSCIFLLLLLLFHIYITLLILQTIVFSFDKGITYAIRYVLPCFMIWMFSVLREVLFFPCKQRGEGARE